MNQKAMNWGVSIKELDVVVSSVEINPVYLPSVSAKKQSKLMNDLKELLKSLGNN